MKRYLLIVMFFLTAGLSGCGKVATPAPVLSPAEQDLVKLCVEEYKLGVTVRPAGNTVWVYLPVEQPFFEFKAKEKDAPPDKPFSKITRVINFLDAKFNGRDLEVEFDITSNNQYPKEPTYSSGYSEQFQANQRNLLTAILRVYGEVPENKQPEFFVMTIADVVKGLEMRMTFYLPDLLRATLDPSFTGEYALRVLSDEARGDNAIIGDAGGKYLKVTALTWQEFLARQIMNRVKFKYQRSDLPLGDSNVNEILASVYDAVTAYNFTEFDRVKLRDLTTGNYFDFRREQLSTFAK